MNPALAPRPLADPRAVLQHVQDTLNRLQDPLKAIAALKPQTTPQATAWVRFRPCWEEYSAEFPAQVVALASVVSKITLKEHGLSFREDGRVGKSSTEGKHQPTPEPCSLFTIQLDGKAANVEYTKDYFPYSAMDHLAFRSPFVPAEPHPLSTTGYLSHFCSSEAVEACGGPEGYARLYAEARLAGREKEFEAAFVGRWPELKRGKKKAPELEPVKAFEVEEEWRGLKAPDDGKELRQQTLF